MDERAFKKHKIYTLLLLIVAMVALVVGIAAHSLKREAVATQGNAETQNTAKRADDLEYYTPNSAPSQENSKPQEGAETPSQYLITIYDGRIGVFRSGESRPFFVSDVRAYLLPEEDIDILLRGIKVNSYAQARSVLEDYE